MHLFDMGSRFPWGSQRSKKFRAPGFVEQTITFLSSAGGRRSPYEDIDQPPQQTPSGIDTQNSAAPGSPPDNLFTT